MDRRSAMFLTLLLGGLAPQSLLAQSSSSRSGSSKSKTRRIALEPSGSKRTRDDEPLDSDVEPANDAGNPADLPPEPGQQWKNFDISRYVSTAHNQSNPQNAIVDWIFRRTGTAPWHGDKIAVLSASRTQLRAYHNAKIIKEVAEVVERFTNSTNDLLSVRVRFVAAVDPRWRYAVYSRLTPVGSGPQGQQIWTLKVDDSAFVMTQMQVHQGFKLLTDKKVEMVNGQTLTLETSETRGFTGGLQRESAAGLGYQPRAEQLDEGVTLRLSPLLTFDGDMIDAAIDLTANTVKGFHKTRVIAPREVGPSELSLEVPEVTSSRLNQTVKSWRLGQTLLISAGIQPGILQSKTGFLNMRIPGTVPTSTELLVFIDAEAVGRAKTASRDRD